MIKNPRARTNLQKHISMQKQGNNKVLEKTDFFTKLRKSFLNKRKKEKKNTLKMSKMQPQFQKYFRASQKVQFYKNNLKGKNKTTKSQKLAIKICRL